MKKLLITNVVYGDMYLNIFLNLHLKSFLDETNIPAFKDRVEYHVFTDEDTWKKMEPHPVFKELDNTVPVHIHLFGWPAGPVNKFEARYQILIQTFRQSVEFAIKANAWCSALTADMVCARGFIGKLIDKMEAGHDTVFMLPLRSAAESMWGKLPPKGALEPLDLCRHGYDNLHPLWVACHWNAAQFTKLPFTLLWNTGTGLIAQSYSITPIVFEPTEALTKVTRVIDVEAPKMFKNPYWATDWVDAPVIGVEPLACYYPPFTNGPSDLKGIKDWATKALDPSQIPFAEQSLYYPSKDVVMTSDKDADLLEQALGVVEYLTE